MENNLIATRYCLDNKTEKSYSELDRLGGGILPDTDKVLKLVQNKPDIYFHQREGDMDNLPEYTITTSNGLSIEEMNEIIMKQPIQVQEFPTTKQAVEKLCEELKNDESYYISWQANIAMAFYDECVRNQIDDDLPLELLHKIANKAADNFLKQLI